LTLRYENLGFLHQVFNAPCGRSVVYRDEHITANTVTDPLIVPAGQSVSYMANNGTMHNVPRIR
jgi:flagella basal body P-ring formation protein FlgA